MSTRCGVVLRANQPSSRRTARLFAVLCATVAFERRDGSDHARLYAAPCLVNCGC